MIKEGQKTHTKYWGNFEVEKIAKLRQPVICHSEETGEAEFMPVIAKIKWEKPPSSDVNEFWFPYWIKIKGKERYGQFSPMIGKDALLQLLREAIRQNFFDKEFLLGLTETIKEKLELKS
jgi:hypothetical protein